MIVVIGILAAITIVSYSGISQRATIATIQSDLTNGAQQAKTYLAVNDAYPEANDCTASPAPRTICIKSSSSNTILTYVSVSPYSSFTLTAQNGNLIYRVSDSYPPGQVTPLTAIDTISGIARAGSVITAGALSPSGATAFYQWQSATASNGTYTNIYGANSSSYTLTSGDTNNYIKVVATGTNTNGGSVTSAAVGPVAKAPPILADSNTGTITNSGGVRTHTFSNPGTYNLTVVAGGTITVTISGAGGGDGGTGARNNYSVSGGDGGSYSSLVYGGHTYLAAGGGGGGGAGSYVFGGDGSAGTGTGGGAGGAGGAGCNGCSLLKSGGAGGAGGGAPYGLILTVGAGGGAGWYINEGSSWGGIGGSGGKITGSLVVNVGQNINLFVGSGGQGGYGYDYGADGQDGSVVISYPY